MDPSDGWRSIPLPAGSPAIVFRRLDLSCPDACGAPCHSMVVPRILGKTWRLSLWFGFLVRFWVPVNAQSTYSICRFFCIRAACNTVCCFYPIAFCSRLVAAARLCGVPPAFFFFFFFLRPHDFRGFVFSSLSFRFFVTFLLYASFSKHDLPLALLRLFAPPFP